MLLALSPQPKIWFVAGLVQVVDPHHLAINEVALPVHVEQMIADKKSYWQSLQGTVHSTLQLPARTHDLQIHHAWGAGEGSFLEGKVGCQFFRIDAGQTASPTLPESGPQTDTRSPSSSSNIKLAATLSRSGMCPGKPMPPLHVHGRIMQSRC